MNKIFKRIMAVLLSALAISLVVVGTAFASDYTTSFSTSTTMSSSVYTFDALEGSSISYTAMNPNCPITGAKYQVKLYKSQATGELLVTDPKSSWTMTVPANGLGSHFAWWRATVGSYYYQIIPFNNKDDDMRPQPITCLNVKFKNFYDKDLVG